MKELHVPFSLDDGLRALFGYISRIIQFSEDDKAEISGSASIVHRKKGEMLFTAGERTKEMYFILKGIVRYIEVNRKGIQMTYMFRMENMVITAYGKYGHRDTALFDIECMEPCTLLRIPHDTIDRLFARSKEAERLGRLLSEMHLLELGNYILDMDTKSILERYDELDEKYPGIHQRVPQRLIASFLRTSAVHLCRLKSARMKCKIRRM